MMRKTSAEAFAKIQGILGGIQLEVYNIIYEFGPITAREIASKMPLYQIDSIRNRPAELEEMGLIEVVGERICNITGFNAQTWDVTGLADPKPVAPKVKPSKFSKAELEAENARLKEHCAELEAIANDCVKALEANNPDMLPYVRFEVRAEGKAGTTRKSEASITAPELIERYCEECKVKPGELIFTKFRAGVRFHPVLRPV
jgi:hypothetical protein